MTLLAIIALVALPLLLIWLARRFGPNSSAGSNSGANVYTGIGMDTHRIDSATPPTGPLVNGAPVDDHIEMQDRNAEN